jgi:hypothetical protein
LDLTAIANQLAGTLNLSFVKAMYLRNDPSSAGNLKVGGNVQANPWTGFWDSPTDINVIPPGGHMSIGSPVGGSLVDGTHKVLRIISDSGTCTGYLLLIGI